MTFFQWRGTVRGLLMALRLGLDPCVGDELFDEGHDPVVGIRIGESFRARTVPLPPLLPPDGAQLTDWYDFERVVMGVEVLAHQFTVLLPVASDRPYDVEEHEQRRRLAGRIVEAEKPAHTTYKIKFFWGMLRIG